MSLHVLAFDPTDQAQCGALDAWLQALPYHRTEWDRGLRLPGHAHLVRNRLDEAVNATGGWAALVMRGDAVVAAAALQPLEWDSTYFGLPMGALDLLRASDAEAGQAILDATDQAIDERGYRHVRHLLDGRDHLLRSQVPDHGWRLTWAFMRMVAETRRAREGVFPVTQGAFDVVETAPEHLTALLEVTKRLPRYNWVEHDRMLPAEARAAYVATRLRNCLETGFADVCLTLLHHDQPVGFNASKLKRHDIEGGSPYTLERDTFVDPLSIPGCAWILQKGILGRLRHEVRYITGRVRIEGTAMLRLLLAWGWDPFGGEYYFVRSS